LSSGEFKGKNAKGALLVADISAPTNKSSTRAWLEKISSQNISEREREPTGRHLISLRRNVMNARWRNRVRAADQLFIFGCC
jgi:hypothetical protein